MLSEIIVLHPDGRVGFGHVLARPIEIGIPELDGGIELLWPDDETGTLERGFITPDCSAGFRDGHQVPALLGADQLRTRIMK